MWWYLLAQCWSLSLKMNPYIDMLRVPTINIHCTDILHNTELYMAWTIPLLIKVNYMFLFAWCFQWYYLHLIDQFPLLLLLIIQFLLRILLLFIYYFFKLVPLLAYTNNDIAWVDQHKYCFQWCQSLYHHRSCVLPCYFVMILKHFQKIIYCLLTY